MDFQKEGVPSSRVNQRPGGNSTFSLSWGNEPQQQQQPQQQQPPQQQFQQQQPPQQQFQQQQFQQQPPPQQVQNQQQQSQQSGQQPHTSVKVHNPPGGRSQISFG